MTTASLIPLRIAVIENDLDEQRRHGWAHVWWGCPLGRAPGAGWVYDQPPHGPAILALS